MKVNDPNTAGVNPESIRGGGLDKAHQSNAVGRHRSAGGNSAGGGTPDSISLSGLSNRLQAANIDSPARLEQIDQLTLDVAASRYQLDPMVLSKTLVEASLRPST